MDGNIIHFTYISWIQRKVMLGILLLWTTLVCTDFVYRLDNCRQSFVAPAHVGGCNTQTLVIGSDRIYQIIHEQDYSCCMILTVMLMPHHSTIYFHRQGLGACLQMDQLIIQREIHSSAFHNTTRLGQLNYLRFTRDHSFNIPGKGARQGEIR